MLKKVSSIIAVAALAATANVSAAIFVQWSGLDGFLRSDDATGLTSPANGSQNALAQLIFTTVNSAGTSGVAGVVGANEQVIGSTILTDTGGTDDYGTLNPQNSSVPFQNGFIYVRVFDQNTGNNPANIIAGTWYYNGPVVATVDNLTLNPTPYNANGANTSSGGLGDFLNQQVQVPEPSVLAFLGIGGLALAIRRRFNA